MGMGLGLLPGFQRKTEEEREEGFTYLGKNAFLKGVVHFEGTVQIDGRIEGEVHSKGTLILGEHAVVMGVIIAETLLCSGRIKGNITANEKVELRKPSLLIGEARTPSITVEAGAHFHGRCDMGLSEVRWEIEDQPALDHMYDGTSPGDMARDLIGHQPVAKG